MGLLSAILELFGRVGDVFLRPPQKEAVFLAYDRIRQFYGVQEAMRHFNRREDDPAPLLGKQVLDVGCGTSAISEFLVLSGAEITAIDINPNVLDTAQAKAKKYGTDITFINGRVEDLIHTEGVYDVVLCLDILEYVEDIDKFLWVVKRLLKKDGMVLFSAINRRPLAWFVHIFLSEVVYRRTPRGSRRYGRFYTPSQIKKALKKQGFLVKNVQGLSFDTKQGLWQLSDTVGTRFLGWASVG